MTYRNDDEQLERRIDELETRLSERDAQLSDAAQILRELGRTPWWRRLLGPAVGLAAFAAMMWVPGNFTPVFVAAALFLYVASESRREERYQKQLAAYLARLRAELEERSEEDDVDEVFLRALDSARNVAEHKVPRRRAPWARRRAGHVESREVAGVEVRVEEVVEEEVESAGN
jgi:hypothetical protein